MSFSDIPDPKTTKHSPRRQAQLFRYCQYAVAAIALIAVAAAADWPTIGEQFVNPDVLADMDPAGVGTALRNTVVYTLLGFACAMVLGVVLALMRLSDVAPYRWAATGYIEFFRGIPALLVFITFAYGVPLAFSINVGLYTTVMWALGLVGSAYVAETLRAGIQAVPPGQVEAARSLGMGPARTMVFVVMPQAFRIVLPPLTNELILLTKDSSLIYVIGLSASQFELTQFGKKWMDGEVNLTPIVVVGLCYLLITVPLGQAVRYLERKGQPTR